MNIQSAVIEQFKNLTHVEFVADGNHIILRGVNGSGKSSILDALMVAFFGKKLLPDDPIFHGAESSKITWNIGNGNQIQFTVSVKIKPDDFSVTVTAYTPTGQKATIKSPAAFLESIMFRGAADPQAFFAKKDSEQVEMMYQICPELKSKLSKIESEYITIQNNRSLIKADGERKKLELEKLSYTAGLPETEIDPADLMLELSKANEHNKQLDQLKEDLVRVNEAIQSDNKVVEQSKRRVQQILQQLELLKQSIATEEAEVETRRASITLNRSFAANVEREIAEFKPVDTNDIKERINKCSAQNQKIRDNIRCKQLEKEIDELRVKYAKGLEDMKAKDQEKIDVIKAANLPVEGLTVGDNCLMFPDPNTGELVRLKSLSTGQQWSVVVGILASFLPAPENGLRVLVVRNLNDLDEKNYLAMLEAANRHGIQLIMHETIKKSDSSQCEIIIQESK